MASLGRARQCWERHGSAVRGTSWQGRAGLGPVTAVACGLVPQASAAPEQRAACHGLVRHGWSRLGSAGLGKGWAMGRLRGSSPWRPLPLAWLGLAGLGRSAAGSGAAWQCPARLGPVTAVGRGLRTPAFRCPWAAKAGLCLARRVCAWRAPARRGMAPHGSAGPVDARLGLAGWGLAGHGGRTVFGGVRLSAAHSLGEVGRVLAWRCTAWSGGAGRGAAGRGEGSTGDRQPLGFEAPAPTRGQDGLGRVRHRAVRPGDVGPGEARDQRATGRHHGSSPWRPRTPFLGVARRGTPRRGAARQSKAPHGPAGLGEAGIYNHREEQ